MEEIQKIAANQLFGGVPEFMQSDVIGVYDFAPQDQEDTGRNRIDEFAMVGKGPPEFVVLLFKAASFSLRLPFSAWSLASRFSNISCCRVCMGRFELYAGCTLGGS